MTTSGLATPPRSARPRVSAPEPKPPSPPKPSTDRRTSFERVLGWSLLVSIVAHVLLLLLSPLVIRLEIPPGATAAAHTAAEGRFGLEMIVAIPSENAPDLLPAQDPLDRSPAVTPTQPVTPPTAGPAGPTGPAPIPTPGAGDQPRGSARDALQPGYRDPRLYVAPNPLPTLQQTDHERYMQHFEARIDALNDSMRVAGNRERRTSDWTLTDRSGKRWGLSGDGLHLGGVTVPRALLPLPAATGDNQRLEEERERQRQRDEIQRQEDDRERRQTQDERIQSTRENQDQRRQNGGGN